MPSKKKGAQRSGAGAEGARDDAHSNEQPDSETAAAATGLDEPASEASGYRSDVSSDDDDDVGAEGGGGDGTSGSGTSGAEAMGPDLGSDVELDPGEVAAAIRRRRQVEQEEQEQRGGAAGGGEGREGGGGGGGGGAGPLPEGELEEGHIYFFYRPKVQQQHPASLNDTARFYMILQPTARSEQQQQQQQQHQHQQQPEGKEEGEPAGGGGAGAAVGAGTAAAAAPMPGEGDAGGGGAEPPAHLASSDTAAEAREGDRPPEDKNGGGSAGGKGGGAAAQQQQPGPLPCRLLVVGKKRMPDAARHERFFGFVEAVASSVPELTSGLGERRYNTKTRGERTQPAARAAGRGMYALFSRHGARSAPHAELAYVLQLPAGGPGPVQQELRIAEEARYVLKIKNPTGVQPPGRPSAGPEPAYSRQQMDRFEAAGTSWLDAAEDLSLLDVAGTEFVLIGAREQPLGHVDEAPAAHLLQAAQQEQQQLLQQQAEAGQQPEGQESAGADPQAGGGAAGAGAGGGGGRGGGGRGVGGKRSRGGSVGGGGGGGGDVAVSAAAEVAGGGGGGEASERTGMPAGTSPAGGGHKHRGAQAQPSKRAKVKGATAATDVAGASGGGGDGSSGGTVPESQVERKQQQAMAAKLEMEIGAVAEGSEGAGTPPGAMHADWAAEGQQRHTIVTAPAETGQWA